MTKLDLDKPVQTRKGEPVRILCTDLKGHTFKVIGAQSVGLGGEYLREWSVDGKERSGFSHLDLVNVPERHEGWINIYPQAHTGLLEAGNVYRTEQDAMRHGGSHKLACIRIEFEEGEGLD